VEVIYDKLIEHYHEVKVVVAAVVLDDDEIAEHQHEARMVDDGVAEHHLEIRMVIDGFE
jgi:hypothetical protein